MYLNHRDVKITENLAGIKVLMIPLVKRVNFLTTNILSVYLCMSGEKTVQRHQSLKIPYTNPYNEGYSN